MSEMKHLRVPNLEHRNFRNDDFWKEIPAWANVSRGEFSDHLWQQKNAIRKVEQVKKILGDKLDDAFLQDIMDAMHVVPMNIRITPYIFALMDWKDPANCPLRMQFLPIKSQLLPDHPFHMADSLAEDADMPVPMLTHRYPDKALFLPTTICPVYCSYCTRSRIIGGSTETVEKETYGANQKKWDDVFEYIVKTPQLEDIVVSGGDAYMLTPKQIRYIGENLLKIPHIRRIRLATKGIAIFPMKVLTDDAWVEAVSDIAKLGRAFGKQVVIHTHFSSTKEITKWSQMAMDRLFSLGIIVRNQAVLQAGVNDSIEEMVQLTRQVSYMNIQPYYVYMHDMVPGCEHLRTTLKEGEEIEKAVRGTTAGFNTPTFVCDLPGGGGKRHVASYEYYDEENGISVWKAPYVKPGQHFVYYDPIHKLSSEAQERWSDANIRKQMVDDALKKAGIK
ncbi:KamA family radical SAM protein [Halobacteriovorax sp. GB3]|uniref:KamA family radical SAM protein n=1 Tax=Halobacteriovorax sp. GB3 TaxID=2719615 RepID=UPI0023622E30|nr:KamA family radical SAM protein [Halobacteriovorax sp. GB3]MDD0852904.1 KamA family radical SAM protein [Halobacteriovorax sp. GB3]